MFSLTCQNLKTEKKKGKKIKWEKNRSDLNLDQAKIFNVYLRVKIYYSCEKKKKVVLNGNE